MSQDFESGFNFQSPSPNAESKGQIGQSSQGFPICLLNSKKSVNLSTRTGVRLQNTH